MPVDARRAIADLRELDRLTGGPDGARRVCWTSEWEQARAFLRERIDNIEGVTADQDEAGNLWATLPGDRPGTVAVGSHIDSVPNGGWLDGALGVMAGLEVLRAAAGESDRHTLALVDFADEEGARFGRSLFGSSAVSGTLDPDELGSLTDADGRPIGEVLAACGIDLATAPNAARRREGLLAYLELHIEQGPVLERENVPAAAVSGTFGVERLRLDFTGQASHAGTTPMDMRRDAGLAAARTAIAVEQIACRHGGVGTTGALRLEPGIPTAVPGRAELTVDLRHAEAAPLAAMATETRSAAADSGCAVTESPIWRIEPIAFDERLVAAAAEEAGTGRVLASGALHDAAEMARHVPAAMVFAPSKNGISHAKEEDTAEPDLERAIDAFGRLALRVASGG
ncbi:MAG: beta-ureidopropionase / N-carbamoyl-L-amino-acid hydrolase [Thermoleophilaceae bacterium]|jgi:N-carbamoyl-L-amino-acid hydrolase|nr:beta-ureidopropionase / N-carbamoyl-L-amino-acid hydrolase [Thermoleophilaceae bacterium]